MEYTVKVVCNHNITRHKRLTVPAWANFITVNFAGEIEAWASEPFTAVDGKWLNSVSGDGEVLDSFTLDCTFPYWSESCFRVREIEQDLPYGNGKIKWIKHVRQASGCGLVVAKWAVDCAIAAGRKGTQEDLLDTIRFVLDANRDGVLDLKDNYKTAPLAEACSALKNSGTVNPLVELALNYWKEG